MTRWTNERVTFCQEAAADVALCFIAFATLALSVKLQEKRRCSIQQAHMDLPRATDPIRLQGESSQLFTATCNISPLLMSIVFAFERHMTHNPYAENRNLFIIAALPFTAQLYRIFCLISERLPNVEGDVSSVPHNKLFKKIPVLDGANSVKISLLVPAIAVGMYWCYTQHWMTKNLLCFGNTIMLVVDLARVRSLRSAFLLVLTASVVCHFWGIFEEFSAVTSALDRTPLPLLISTPTNVNLTSFLSLRSIDLLIIGIVVSFFRRFDSVSAQVIQKNTGDLVVKTTHKALYLASIVGCILGMTLSFVIHFGQRTSEGTLLYTGLGSILLPLIMATFQGRFRTLSNFNASSSPFILC